MASTNDSLLFNSNGTTYSDSETQLLSFHNKLEALATKQTNFFEIEDEDDFPPPDVKISSNKISTCSHMQYPKVIQKQKSNSI